VFATKQHTKNNKTMITNYTNRELKNKINDLIKTKFTYNSALRSYISDNLTLKCKWEGAEYNTNVYLEKLDTDEFPYSTCFPYYQICINSNMNFSFSAQGLIEAVQYINE
tara:strand:+ start:1187 stop:1516 length:330 start_codon:yes stop_codon:yes gene_type:complete